VSRFWVCCRRKTIRNVTMVVEVLITKRGPRRMAAYSEPVAHPSRLAQAGEHLRVTGS
jgi:hypothetical protein